MKVYVSIDGKPTPADQANISIFDHGFLFGDSIYEVVRTVGGKLFAWQPHLDRLFHSASQIGLTIPWTSAQLRQETMELLASSDLREEAYVRLIITRGVGALNIDPSSCGTPTRVFIARPLPKLPDSAYTKGIALSLVETMRNPKRATNPGIKSGNYLNNVLALMEARRKNALEAVMLNENGYVTECTTSNLFIVRGGEILTPSLECGLLAGITRALILEAARKAKLPIKETLLTLDDLASAEELFITSTTRNVVPVARLDDRTLAPIPGPVTEKMARLYRDIQEHYLDTDQALAALA